MNIRKYVHPKSSWEKMKMADEIIKELWKTKDAISHEHGFDVKALVAHLRAKKHDGGDKIVNL